MRTLFAVMMGKTLVNMVCLEKLLGLEQDAEHIAQYSCTIQTGDAVRRTTCS